MCPLPSPDPHDRFPGSVFLRAVCWLLAASGIALAGCGQKPASTPQPAASAVTEAASVAASAASEAASTASAAESAASAAMPADNEPSRDHDAPTPLPGQEVKGSGIGKNVSYYWGFRAPAGTLKLTVTGKNQRSGYTDAVNTTLYGARAETLCKLSLGNHTESTTKTVDCAVSEPQNLVLRVDLQEETIDYAVRIDGAIELAPPVATGSASAAVASVTGPGSTDIDEPTRLQTQRIRGEGPKQQASYYYALNAGPGEMVVTIDGRNERSGHANALQATVYTAQRSEKVCEGGVGNAWYGKRTIFSCNFDKREPVILRLDVLPETIEFRARVDGAYDFEEYVPPKQVVIALDAAVLFDTGSWTLKPDARQTLDEAAARVKKFAGTPVVIAGHTDDVGSDASNLTLSQRRAEAVRDYFVQQAGMDAGRFTVKGLGESQPVADNGTDAGRARNRRVEVMVQR